LRYAPIVDTSVRDLYAHLPATVVRLDDSPVVNSAQEQLVEGIRRMLGRTLRATDRLVPEDMIVLGKVENIRKAFPEANAPSDLMLDGYWLHSGTLQRHRVVLVAATSDRGVLYGAFALLRHMVLLDRLDELDEKSNPYAPIRWTNEWDNLDGSIERGYGGRSIFFENGNVLPNLTRARDYARLLASIGINGCTVNNVNANPRVLTPEFLPQLARIAAAFRPWGVQMSISVDLGSPKTIGGLDTFDPLDPRVAAWWKQKADELYKLIPDLAGFVLKADSEGRVGPSTYGRTHAEAANALAAALKPHGGILIYRGFVYNHHMDWHDLKHDRARAAYDNFKPLDGKFDENVAVQIKYGPIDFQVREPVSPLIAALRHTNETLELQVTQEYTGQQRQLCYLVPMWKQVLDFNMRMSGADTPVKDIVAGKTFHRPLGGFVGVTNVGNEPTWMGNDLAMANLYGFGRLAWDPHLTAREITGEWTRRTFSADAEVVATISKLQLESWHVYENYTGPLGLGTLTDILHSHYGPNIESAERNGWGQWIRADHEGIGMDRTMATGTGYIGQYPPEVAQMYESLKTCPDNLLLFMHHVPYTHVLHSGETLIQYIYNSHYAGAAEAQEFPEWWRSLRQRIDPERYIRNLQMLDYQAGEAIVWRDAICKWFERGSGISDAQGRVGYYPRRIEAESMQLEGYKVREVTPWEDASNGKAVVCEAKSCLANFNVSEANGWYEIDVQYFDENSGVSEFQVRVNGQQIASWSANMSLPSNIPNGDTSVRKKIGPFPLRRGDQIEIVGVPGGGDQAALDYVALHETAIDRPY
jgi:alpha-glucuronidase